MRNLLVVLAILAAAASVDAGAPDYTSYGKALSENVDSQGGVDYRGLKAHPQSLEDFLHSIAVLAPADYQARTNEEKIAFWINAYNGLTLKTIIDHYPVQSIREIGGVWEKLSFTVMGKGMTLDEIEHEMLRAQFNEPRIHAALVCAAKSCPPLRNEPYHGSTLNDQLDDQMRKFLSRPTSFKADPGSSTVYLSEIFKWFGEDFAHATAVESRIQGLDEKESAVMRIVSLYVRPEAADSLRRGGYRIGYLPYDWTLNER